jgi:hypothetical protein
MNFHHDSVAATVRVRRPALTGRKAHREFSAKPDREPQSPSEPGSVSDAGIIVWRCGTFAATDHRLLITDH